VVLTKLIAGLPVSLFVYGGLIEIAKIPENLVMVENGMNNSILIIESVILVK
jgi:hypothetical protein